MTRFNIRNLVSKATARRYLTDSAPTSTKPPLTEPPTIPANDKSSDFKETVRDVVGFLVLSIASGAFLLNEVKDLGVPQKKKKKEEVVKQQD